VEEQKKYKIIGSFIYYIMRILSKTYRVEKVISDEIVEESAIYITWHNKIIPLTTIMDKIKKKAVLASPSKDGELITVPLRKFGYKVIRGSSGRDGIKGLLQMIRDLNSGYAVGTPVDGPKGPIYKIKPGMLFLAQKSGKPIIPIGAASKNKWVLRKTWDKMEIPKPFSNIVCILGDPIYIGPDEDLKEVALEIEKTLINLDARASKRLEL